MNIQEIQKALREFEIDGWLFCDFRNRDSIAQKILELDTTHLATRRWFYFVPANGDPVKLANRIEPNKLDKLPGRKRLFQPWEELHTELADILKDSKKVAMNYSPMNAIPYVAMTDAGTVELVRSCGVEVVSSADLVSLFESYLDENDKQSHIEASVLMQKVKDETFEEVGNRIRAGKNPTEYEIQQFMHSKFSENGLFWDHGPIVGVNEHAADPHFEPTPENSHYIKAGDLLLLDLFARKNEVNSIWYDITWMAYIGNEIPERIQSIWDVLKAARDAAFKLVFDRFSNDIPIQGWEVDKAARDVINNAGFGQYFIHRTGHNISNQLHGNGAHMDNFETKDERYIIKGSCFSIEPGIYMTEEKIGFRTEIDVFVDNTGKVEVFGDIQQDIVKIKI